MFKHPDIVVAAEKDIAEHAESVANLFELDDDFHEKDLVDGERFFLGNLADNLLFIEVDGEDVWLYYQPEREPAFVVNDKLFGGGVSVASDSGYEFSMTDFDTAADLDFDDHIDQVYSRSVIILSK